MKISIKIVLTSLCLVAIAISAVVAIPILKPERLSADRLSDDQVSELRTEYPLYTEYPPYYDMLSPSLNRDLRMAATVLYAKSTGKRIEFTDSVKLDPASPEAKLEEKSKNYGIFFSSVERYGYEVEVIQDSSGMFKKGDMIMITRNAEFEPYTPALKEGMEFISLVWINPVEYQQAKYQFSNTGFYYVTNDGYAVASYEEIDYKFTGMKADDLFKQIAQLHERFYGKSQKELYEMTGTW